MENKPKRVSVVGTSGSGKTTVAKEITQIIDTKHIELDAIHWRKGWQEIPELDFREIISRETAEESWVIDGNYSDVRDIVWSRADTLVWLDLPFFTLFSRIFWRTLRRIVTRERLWNDNVESIDALIGSDSMLLWVVKTYWRRKKDFPVLLSKLEYSHLQVVRLKTKKDIEEWVSSIEVSEDAHFESIQ